MSAAFANYCLNMTQPTSPIALNISPPLKHRPNRSPHYQPYAKHPSQRYTSPDAQYIDHRHTPQQLSPRGTAYHHHQQQPQQQPRQPQPQPQYYNQPPRYQQAPPPPLTMPQEEQRQQQQLSPKQPPQSSTYSSKITQETGCHIYRYTNNGDTVDQSLHQIVGSNGKVYVEYIPGHSLVYIPSSASPTIVMGQMMGNSRQGRLKEKSPKNARPSNVFFKYRSHKLPELTLKYPKLNQTVISRMVADHWKAETDEVKDRFKKQYKNEMIQYEVAKKLSRYQSAVIPREYREEDFTANPPAYSPFSTSPTHVSGPPSASSNHEAAQRQQPYPTLPTSSPRQ